MPAGGGAAPAFSDYLQERYPALRRAACAITRDPHRAEDLLQAALVRVGDHWEGLRDVAAADAYVRRAMVNQHISWTRRTSTRAEVAMAVLPEPRQADDELPLSIDRAELWRSICRLPARQRACVALRYLEELSEAETAAALGCSVGTVKSSTSRGLSSLRRAIADPVPA